MPTWDFDESGCERQVDKEVFLVFGGMQGDLPFFAKAAGVLGAPALRGCPWCSQLGCKGSMNATKWGGCEGWG